MIEDYLLTCSVVKTEILNRWPYAKPIENATNDINHTLWMIERIQEMDDQRKIDRWLGWILAKAHTLGVLAHNDKKVLEIRKLVKVDLAGSS